MRIWRKIKKYYFKIYHFFKLIGIFLILCLPSIVYADEYNNCYNEYKNGTWEFEGKTGNNAYFGNKIEVTPGEYLYVRFFTGTTDLEYGDNSILFGTQRGYDSNGNYVTAVSPGVNWNKDTQVLRIKIESSWTWIKYIKLTLDARSNYTIVEGTPVVTSIGENNLLECPEQPEPPAPGSNEIYDDFLTIYMDRFSYLGNGLLENPYLFIFASIIFGFVVLEIFLHILHIRGGYKK